MPNYRNLKRVLIAGTALATVFSRRLQFGDVDGHLRRALKSFPLPEIATRVLNRYFVPGGKPEDAPFKTNGMPTLRFSKSLMNLTVVANFAEVFLAKEGFYDGTVFHRVINDFMVQGGDPTGTGRGGPGYKWNDEKPALGIEHAVGSLSMANAGPNTNGSQFFITHIATDWLNGKHAVFGQVTSGQDVVNKTKQGDTLKKVTISEA